MKTNKNHILSCALSFLEFYVCVFCVFVEPFACLLVFGHQVMTNTSMEFLHYDGSRELEDSFLHKRLNLQIHERISYMLLCNFLFFSSLDVLCGTI